MASLSFRDPVSTHSHPKVAAMALVNIRLENDVSTHSHPKVAAALILSLMTLV